MLIYHRRCKSPRISPTLSEAYLHGDNSFNLRRFKISFSSNFSLMFGRYGSRITTRISPGFDAATIFPNRLFATFERVSERSFSSSTKPNKTKRTIFEWYEAHLESSPVKTKMITGSVLWGLGDFVAQSTSGVESYDFPRTGRAVFFGFALHAPASHLHFNFLEWMTVRSGVTGLGIPIFKTIMEQVRIFCVRIKSFPFLISTIFVSFT